MSKHTPGPWRVDNPNIVGPHPKDPEKRERIVATVIVAKGTYIQETAANAHLIAAAPELLESLEELLRVDDEWHGSVNSEMAFARSKARMTIAKARAALAATNWETKG